MINNSGSPRNAWKALTDWFHPQTLGREIDLFSDLFNARMLPDGNPIRLYARLTLINFQLSSDVEDPAVVRCSRSNLRNMKMLSALPKSYEAEVSARRVDASTWRLDPRM